MLGLAQIAKAIDSPQSFTAKILQKLSRGNKIISSARGPNGGFYMTEEMKKIPIRSVLTATKGTKFLKSVLSGRPDVQKKSPAPCMRNTNSLKPKRHKCLIVRLSKRSQMK